MDSFADPDSTSMNSLGWYKYSPLQGPQKIRLLSNHGSPSHDSKIICRLVEVDLEQVPHYIAISYTWEGQQATREIEVDGLRLLITPNADAVLKRVRPHVNFGAYWVWIDSVCINQAEDAQDERGRQVALMAQIYEKAMDVCIWLGHSRMVEWPQHRKVATWMQKLAEVPESEDKSVQLENFRPVVSLVGAPDYFEPDDLSHFVENTPWFGRLWTLQEAVLAKGSRMVWQDIEIPYRTFLWSVLVLQRLAKVNTFASFVGQALLPAAASGIYAIEVLSGIYDPYALTALIAFLKTSKAHDKVFAVHGILSATGLILPEPDYSKPAEVVYWDYTRCLISQRRCRGLLEDLSGLRQLPAVASWVPDFSIPAKPHEPIKGSQKRGTIYYDIKVTDSDRSLLVKGVVYDAVAYRATLSVASMDGTGDEAFESFDDGFPNRWTLVYTDYKPQIALLWNIRVLQSFIQFVTERFPSKIDGFTQLTGIAYSRGTTLFDGSPMFSRLLQLLGASTFDENRYDQAEEDKHPVSDSKVWTELLSMPKCPSLNNAHLWKTAVKISREWRPRLELLHLLKNCVYQTIFTTSSGVLGMSPYPVQAGDKIFVYVGSHFPAIIREKTSGTYEWITQADIYGVSSDDVLEENEARLEYLKFV